MWRYVVVLRIVALAAAIVGLVLMLTPVEVGDSYCGTVLYDTSTAEPCTTTMILRRVVVVGCAAIVIAIAVLRAWNGERARRTYHVAATVLFFCSAIAVVVMLNRLLQPTTTEFCGSVVNRHRTYEPLIEQRCDQLLGPFRVAAAIAGVSAVGLAGFGAWIWRHHPHLDKEIAPRN